MIKSLHITQDTYGYWFLSAEHSNGKLDLKAHQITSLDQLVEHARDMAAEHGLSPSVLLIEKAHRRPPLTEDERPDHYTQPAPRKAEVHGL